MRHFSSEQWTDFVRKTLKQEEMRKIEAHLQSACEQCSSDLATWTRVRDLAAQERAFEPPTSAVRMVKAAMKRDSQPSRLPVATLLFDSLSGLAVAGIRSSESGARQMLYGLGEYRIDLRLESNLDADQALLVGQALKSGNSPETLGNITVSLMRGGELLGFVKANEFGEFQLECDLTGQLELQLSLPDGAQLRLPIVEPTSADEKEKHLQNIDHRVLTKRRDTKRKSTRKKV